MAWQTFTDNNKLNDINDNIILSNTSLANINNSLNSDYYENALLGLNSNKLVDGFTSYGTVSQTENIISSGGLNINYPFLSVAQKVFVASANIGDSFTGTGAKQIVVGGLDANYLHISETINLNGTTPVQSVNNFLRINYMYISTFNNNTSIYRYPLGKIYCGYGTFSTATGFTNNLRVISTADNTDRDSVYTLLDGYVGFVKDLQITTETNGNLQLTVYLRNFGDTFFRKIVPYKTNKGVNQLGGTIPFPLSPRTDIIITGSIDTNSAYTSCHMSLILHKIY